MLPQALRIKRPNESAELRTLLEGRASIFAAARQELLTLHENTRSIP
jgi:hypothetical protein